MLKHPDFLPAGPLVYFVMDKNGGSKIGLYEHKKTGSLVLLGRFLGREVIFWLEQRELDRCMEEKITLFELLKNCARTHIDYSSLTVTANYGIIFLTWLLFNEGLSKLKFHIAYPNFYYVYREMVGHPDFESSKEKLVKGKKSAA